MKLFIRGNVLVVLMLLAMMPTVDARALSIQSDTLNICFRLDSIQVDMNFGNNAREWQSFQENYRRYFATTDSLPLRIDIYSGASPEGPAAHNRWLGENRGIAVRRLIRQLMHGRDTRYVIHNEGARWDGLYEAVANSSEPWRDEVLRIIDQPASADETSRDHREQKLRALHGGTVWPVLLERYMAPLRSGSSAILSFLNPRDTVYVRDTVVMAMTMTICPDNQQKVKKERGPVVRQPVWILRTNIPLLATATPNVQAELSLGHKDRWSLNIEGAFSWWTFAYNAYANEMIYGSLELRRWLGSRERHHTLDGWHVGLGVGGGYGDVEWRSKGYQAEVYSGFVNIGWQHRFGSRRQWAFDAGVGLGFAYVPWRRYDGSTLFPVGKEEEHDNHLMWQETGRTNWLGATHLNISVGYVFNQPHAADRRRNADQREADRQDYLQFKKRMKAEEKQKRINEKRRR